MSETGSGVVFKYPSYHPQKVLQKTTPDPLAANHTGSGVVFRKAFSSGWRNFENDSRPLPDACLLHRRTIP